MSERAILITIPVSAGLSAILRTANALFWVCAIGLAIWHLYILIKFKIDLPISDEWADFSPWRGMSLDWSWRWLLATTNSHPMIFSRIIAWFFIISDGRNLVVQVIVQFLMISSVYLFMIALAGRVFKIGLGVLAIGFFAGPASPNFYWSFMFFIFIHIALTSIAVFFISSDKRASVVWGYVIAAAAFPQAGQGLGSNIGVVAFGLFLALLRRQQWPLHIWGVAFIIACELLWLALVPKDNALDVANYPWDLGLWTFLGGLLANGMGLVGSSGLRLDPTSLYIVGLLVWLAGVVGALALVRALFTDPQRCSRLTVFSLGLFAAGTTSVLVMGLGRVSAEAFSLRYYVYGWLLFASVFFVAVSIVDLYLKKPKAVFISLGLINLVVLTLFLQNLDLNEAHRREIEEARDQLVCARAFFATPEAVKTCPEGPFDWGVKQGHMETAEAVRSSFCFTIMNESPAEASIEDCYRRMLAPLRSQATATQ